MTQRGRTLYAKRGQTVESVFGQIKDGRGCDRFMQRGQEACDSGWKLLCATHNLLKLWRQVMSTVEKARCHAHISGEVGVQAAA